MKISPAQSAYLDFLRFVAALAVLLGHMKQNGFDMAWMPLARFSHERPEAGQSRPPPAGVKQSGKATFA